MFSQSRILQIGYLQESCDTRVLWIFSPHIIPSLMRIIVHIHSPNLREIRSEDIKMCSYELLFNSERIQVLPPFIKKVLYLKADVRFHEHESHFITPYL